MTDLQITKAQYESKGYETIVHKNNKSQIQLHCTIFNTTVNAFVGDIVLFDLNETLITNN